MWDLSVKVNISFLKILDDNVIEPCGTCCAKLCKETIYVCFAGFSMVIFH